MTTLGQHPTDALLDDFLLGKLDGADEESVAGHLARCASCLGRAGYARRDALTDLLASADGEDFRVPDASPSPTLGFAPAPTITAEPPPELLSSPKYRLLRLLGQGGMGAVWLCEHLVMGRLVAVKVIRPDLLARPGNAERFLAEVRAVARLSHPNLVAAYDAEPVGASHFLAMEFVEGPTLAESLATGPLPLAVACRAARDAARGLAAAHAAGLVHRDVKPANLIRGPDGTVKILDFGLAGLGDEPGSGGLVAGTLDYLAPEQAEAALHADARSDLYALGCTLYHLLAGRAPFAGCSPSRLLQAHRDEMPPPLPGLPPALAGVLARLLAKRPADRFPDAAAVAAALEPFAGKALPRPGRPWAWCAAALLLAALLGLAYPCLRRSGAARAVHDGKSLVLAGHTLRVRALLFSPDGKRLYSGGNDGVIRAWDMPEGREAARYRADARVYGLALAEGGLLVAATDDGLRCWDAQSGASVPRFPRQPGEQRLNAVSASPDGKRLATGHLSGAARVWDVATGKHLKELDAPLVARLCYSVAWSPDGKRIAAGLGGTLGVLDVANGEWALGPRGPKSIIRVAWSPDGRRVASIRWRGRVEVHDAGLGEPLAAFEAGCDKEEPARRVSFAPSGHLVVAGRGTRVDLWDWKAGKRIASLAGHAAWASAAIVSPDGTRIASAGEDAAVRLWNWPGGTPCAKP